VPDSGSSPESLLRGLDDEQRRAVETPNTPLRILAGAGSGKTRVLTRRIAYQSGLDRIDPRRVLALTFTRKAAGELNQRLRALGLRDAVAAGTFHAVAYAQLRTWWADQGRAAPALLDRKAPLVARTLPRGLEGTAVLDVIAEIEWAKARRITPERYAQAAGLADRRPAGAPALIAEAYARYEKEKNARRVVDFDDLLGLCLRALHTDDAFAQGQRHRFRHLFVDEYQDVNPLQRALLAGWLGDGNDLCVVGDPNQAIYSWNGADAEHLIAFEREFPGATTVTLQHNYRSTPQILAAASAVLHLPRAQRIRATRPEGPAPTVRSYDDDRAEASGIARRVRDAHRPGTAWSHQAVLVRTNAQLPAIETALRRAGIPFRTRGGGLLTTPEGKNLLRRLERSDRPLATIVTDLSVELATRAGELDDDSSATVDDAAGPAHDTRAAVLDTVIRLAREHLAIEPEATGSRFVSALHANPGDDTERPGDAVDLATFHAAKGLEWPVVHLAGLEQGLVPISFARTPEALDEEQRLLYVALTRAEQELHCSWCRERAFGSRTSRRNPSPWLDDVALASGRPVAGPDKAARVAAERKKLKSDGSARRGRASTVASDDPILVALKAWRSSAAKAANVPAYVVFSDATLEAVASAKPTDRRSLLALSGLGPVKAERYGDTLLQLVAEHRTDR
jgi:DNA helicase-2/ATP-dependent DNA helicase PcrA